MSLQLDHRDHLALSLPNVSERLSVQQEMERLPYSESADDSVTRGSHIASSPSRTQEERRYGLSLRLASNLLKELDRVFMSKRNILDVTNRCLGLSLVQAEDRKLPGEIKLEWRQGVIVQISPNGNMTLFYSVHHARERSRFVKHYYLTTNGLVNAANDLATALSGQPIRAFE